MNISKITLLLSVGIFIGLATPKSASAEFIVVSRRGMAFGGWTYQIPCILWGWHYASLNAVAPPISKVDPVPFIPAGPGVFAVKPPYVGILTSDFFTLMLSHYRENYTAMNLGPFWTLGHFIPMAGIDPSCFQCAGTACISYVGTIGAVLGPEIGGSITGL